MILIIGYGSFGRKVVNYAKTVDKIVVIDKNASIFESLENIDFEYVVGDASNRDILRFIIKPQLLFTLFLAFFMVFVLVFSHQEVSSILGYRTYAEDFLAQISLMEDISQTALASVPFYLLAMVMLGFLLFFVKFYHLKFELKERLDTLIFTSISPKVINSIFSLIVASLSLIACNSLAFCL